MQHDISEDNNLPRLHEKAGDHDVNQLQIQENSSSPHDLVIDFVREVREMRDPTGESFSRQNQQGTRIEHPHLARSRKRHTSTIKAGAKVVLKTSTYPNKRNVANGTIHSTDPRTKACGIELGAEFALVCIDQRLLDNEELVREVSDCKTIGEAFSSRYLIAWPSAFIREKDN
uniref:Transposase Tnp1/En/Spm-like domain-containing protein n=1 Tax=Hordeum vulgare subsp. vulgare TaxID=112509 RepID=A0A8I7B2R5_HORVV